MCCNGQLTVLAGRWDNGFEHNVPNLKCVVSSLLRTVVGGMLIVTAFYIEKRFSNGYNVLKEQEQ
jgi:hypothetical protein